MAKTLTPEQKAKKAAAAKARRLAAGQATPAEAARIGRIVASGSRSTRRLKAPEGVRSVNVGRNHYKADSNGCVIVPSALAFVLVQRDGYRLAD